MRASMAKLKVLHAKLDVVENVKKCVILCGGLQ
jgi:hypothetical protein